jgi:hypothetical protein
MAQFITSSPGSTALRELAPKCDDATSRLIREAADEIDSLRDALLWCGGSSDFAPEGKAHAGWLKIVGPLFERQSNEASSGENAEVDSSEIGGRG